MSYCCLFEKEVGVSVMKNYYEANCSLHSWLKMAQKTFANAIKPSTSLLMKHEQSTKYNSVS